MRGENRWNHRNADGCHGIVLQMVEAQNDGQAPK